MTMLKRGFIRRRLWGRRDERGAIMVLAAFGIIVAVIAASLAVDLGQVGQERRRNQKVADLAALDASRDLTNVQSRAVASAARNKVQVGGDKTVTAVIGTKSGSSCVASGTATTVCVKVTSQVDYAFNPGGRTVTAIAVAGIINSAGFTMGSKLASATIGTDLPIVNALVSRWIGASGNINVLSYDGLMTSTINLRQLATQLGFGSMNQLLTSNITLGQLLSAATTVMTANGASAANVITPLTTIQAAVTNTTQFKLGDFLKVASGYEDTALDSNISLFELFSGSAQLINKNNFLDAGSVLSVPNPLGSGPAVTAKLGVKVIEGPKHYIGGTSHPPTPHATTSQVEVTITPSIDLNFNTPLLNILNLLQIGTQPVRVVGDMPIVFTSAGADGNLTDIRCTGSQGITVQVQRKAISTSTSATLKVYTDLSTAVPLLAAANVRANITVGSPNPVTATVGAPGSPDTLTFSYPSEFWPSTVKTTPGAPANATLSGSGPTKNVSASVGALGLQINILSTLGLDSILTSLVSPILTPLMNNVITKATSPALKALGINIGPVDVTAPLTDFDPTTCGQPGLLA